MVEAVILDLRQELVERLLRAGQVAALAGKGPPGPGRPRGRERARWNASAPARPRRCGRPSRNGGPSRRRTSDGRPPPFATRPRFSRPRPRHPGSVAPSPKRRVRADRQQLTGAVGPIRWRRIIVEAHGQVANRPVGAGATRFRSPGEPTRPSACAASLIKGMAVQAEVGGIKVRQKAPGGPGLNGPGDVRFENGPEAVPGHQRADLVPVLVGRHAPDSAHEIEPAAGEGESGLAHDLRQGAPGGLGRVAGRDRGVVEAPASSPPRRDARPPCGRLRAGPGSRRSGGGRTSRALRGPTSWRRAGWRPR